MIIFIHSHLQLKTEIYMLISCFFLLDFSSAVTMEVLLSKRLDILDTNKKKNLFKILILTQLVAPETVRHFFDTKIPPNDLANVLNKNKEIIENLWKNKRHKVIKDSQLELLIGVPGVVFPFYPQTSKKKGNI